MLDAMNAAKNYRYAAPVLTANLLKLMIFFLSLKLYMLHL